MLKAIYLFFSWIIQITAARRHQQDCQKTKEFLRIQTLQYTTQMGGNVRNIPRRRYITLRQPNLAAIERAEGSVAQVTSCEDEEVSNNRPWPRSRRELMILIGFLQGVIDPKPYQWNQKQCNCHFEQAPDSNCSPAPVPAHRDHLPLNLGRRQTTGWRWKGT